MKKAIKNITTNWIAVLAYFLLFILLAITSVNVISDSLKIDREYDKIIGGSLYKISLLRENRLAVEQIQPATIDEVFHPSSLDNKMLAEIQKNILQNDSNFRTYKNIIESRQEDSLFIKTVDAWLQYKQKRVTFIDLDKYENEAISYFKKEEKKAYDSFYKSANVLSGYIYNNIKLRDKIMDRFAFYSRLKINVLILLTIILLIVVGVMVIKNVKKLTHQHNELIEKDKILHESEHLYKNLFNKSPMPKWVCDRRTLKFYEVNDAAIKHYGYTKEEFLNLTVFELRPEEDHEKIKEYTQSNLNASSNEGIRRHIKKNGEIIWVEIVLDDIMYRGKEAILVVINDITEKLKAEKMIRDSEESYRLLFDNSPVFNWVCEIPTLKYLDVNEMALTHYGYSKEEFLSMTAFDLLAPADREKIKLSVQNSAGNYRGYDRHLKKNGEVIDVEVRVQKINYKGKEAGLVTGIDVTEKKKVEEKLIREEEFYRTILENSSDIQLISDKGGSTIYASSSISKIFGYAKEDLIGKTRNDIWHPEDIQLHEEKIRQLIATPGKTIVIELRCLDKNKRYKWCEARISNQLHNPAIKGFVSNYSEISERKHAEKRMIESEANMRAILDNTNTAFQLMDTNFNIIAFNQVASDWTFMETGKPLEKGRSYSEYIREERKTILEDIYKKVLAGEDMEIETRGYHSSKWYKVNMKRITGENNSVLGLCVSSLDITLQKLSEEKIRNSEELYRLLFSKSPISAWISDKNNTQFLEVNDTAVEKYGYSREEFLNMTAYDVKFKEDLEELNRFLKYDASKQSEVLHRRHMKKNGECIYVEMHARTIHYKGSEAFLVLANDITERVYLQNQLIEEKVKKQKEITRATINGQEKERHELGKELHDNVNQILATAKLYLEFAMTNETQQTEFIAKGKDLVNDGINEIRKISKSLVPPSLGELTLRDSLEELLPAIKLTGKNIRLNLKGLKEDRLCNGLKISVYRIVQEQLNNIMKYAEASDINIVIRHTANVLDLCISDNGKGFDMSKKRNGIGITNMINRANLFNGAVIIDSSPGNGCRVHVNFKLRTETEKKMQLSFDEISETFNMGRISKN